MVPILDDFQQNLGFQAQFGYNIPHWKKTRNFRNKNKFHTNKYIISILFPNKHFNKPQHMFFIFYFCNVPPHPADVGFSSNAYINDR